MDRYECRRLCVCVVHAKMYRKVAFNAKEEEKQAEISLYNSL